MSKVNRAVPIRQLLPYLALLGPEAMPTARLQFKLKQTFRPFFMTTSRPPWTYSARAAHPSPARGCQVSQHARPAAIGARTCSAEARGDRLRRWDYASRATFVRSTYE
jgi:hypothetical protein